MRAKIVFLLLALAVFAPSLVAQTRTARTTLDIYVVDVDGGNSVLFVTPSGESLLIDTGHAGIRDVGRIMAAAKDAGVTQIDRLILTHWHSDHFGGTEELASHIPIKQFIDHGPNVQPGADADEFLQKTYPPLYSKAKHTVAKAGDKISVAGLDVRVVTSAGETIKTPLPGAGEPNAYCDNFKPGENNFAEDPQSVGTHITFGKFRTLHLADLPKNKEFELMCPNNRIGTVDVLLVSSHGEAGSNSPVLVHALRPRVAIMNDGARKGGHPEVMQTLHLSPGLEDLWEMHFSLLSGQEYTVPGMFIANLVDHPQPSTPVAPMPVPPPGTPVPPALDHNGTAYWIKVSAQANGSFTVTNARNGFSKTYRGVMATN